MTTVVNIIIRTFNEEDWIKFCLNACLCQKFDNFVITVVDSKSTDKTTEIIKSFQKNNADKITLTTVDIFKPGNAINVGAEVIKAEFLVCLSAHCIPADDNWLSSLVLFMQKNPDVAGAYGKQLPLSCTNSDDARDLFITFGDEQQIFKKNYFFHNAHSIIRRLDWVQEKFDDNVSHVEDRLWAKAVINKGRKIAYLPDARVYHYHGLHQHGNNESFRASSVVEVMKRIDGEVAARSVSEILKDQIEVPILVIVPYSASCLKKYNDNLDKIRAEYSNGSDLYLISDLRTKYKGYTSISRASININEKSSLRDLMRVALIEIEKIKGANVDALVFYDLSYRYLYTNFGNKCKEILFNSWLPAVMPAWKDYGNYWIKNKTGYKNLHNSFNVRSEKPEVFRSVLGQGAAIRASEIRSMKSEISQFEIIWTEDAKLLVRD